MAIKELMYRISNPRKAKDVFFRAIFGEDKEALLQLYNALNDTDYDNPDELEIVTIKGAIFITMKNDVAYMLAGVLNLYEHQSTVNPNMPVRFLVYLGQEYQKIIEKSSKSIYGTSIVQLPTPKCVVFYNGDNEIEDDQVIKLSDAYINKDVIPDAELTVRVININYGHNKELMDKCEKLMEYSKFMEILRENKRRYGIKRAIKESIEYCLDNNILTDFLREHRAEVPGFLLTNFDKRKYERTIREEGFEDGEAHGRKEGQFELLKAQVRNGVISVEAAAGYAGVSVEEFIESKESNAVDEATKEVASYVEGIKHTPELESGIMTLQDKIDLEKMESFNEGHQEGQMELLISMVNDGVITIENAAKSLNITEEEFEQKYKAYQSGK